MADEFDINKVFAEALVSKLDQLYEKGKKFFTSTANKIKLSHDKTYKDYLTNIFNKYSTAKSFLIRNEVPLNKFYVPLYLHSNDNKISVEAKFDNLLTLSKLLIISGSAGSGKSMIVRQLIIDSILSKTHVPVFIELRQYNTYDGDLVECISNTLEANKFALGRDYINKAIKAGHFVILLDGYDEIAFERRSLARNAIHNFLKLYDNNVIIMTSRIDQELEGWQSFSLLQVSPLSLEQACNIILKLPFDETLKNKFANDLRGGLFKAHKSLLSNPLLLSIMLLSYGQSATIPNKISVFYNQAYEALFERHDALKDGFCRLRSTKLDIQDFAKLFSAFCIQAYDKHKYEFTQTESLQYIARSQDISGISCKKDDYLRDLIQSVCLLIQDGIQIVFAHRSFQEYFSARFICDATEEVQEQLIQKYKGKVNNDSIFSMLHELRPEVIENFYIIPDLEEMFTLIKVKREPRISNFYNFARVTCSKFIFRDEKNGILVQPSDERQYIELVLFVLRKYGSYIDWKGFRDDGEQKKIMAKWSKQLNGGIDINDNPRAKDFLLDISKGHSLSSLQTLKDVHKILSIIKNKSSKEKKSLEEILNLKNQ